MDELIIEYSISKRSKIMSILSGIYLSAMSITLMVGQVINKNYAFVFYACLAGLSLGVVSILVATIWQYKRTIIINNDELNINLPNQRINGTIMWDSVSQLGIGLSYITIITDETNYKIDLENIMYSDLKKIKSKLIEVCEAKSIPFNNI